MPQEITAITARHQRMLQLRAEGMSLDSIALVMGVGVDTVRKICASEMGQKILGEMQDRGLSDIADTKERLRDLATKAVDLYEEVVVGRIPASAAVRLSAANAILDRSGFPRGVKVETDAPVLTGSMLDRITEQALKLNLVAPKEEGL